MKPVFDLVSNKYTILNKKEKVKMLKFVFLSLLATFEMNYSS